MGSISTSELRSRDIKNQPNLQYWRRCFIDFINRRIMKYLAQMFRSQINSNADSRARQNRYPVAHSFAVRYYNSLGRAAAIVFARGKLLIPTYVRDRLTRLNGDDGSEWFFSRLAKTSAWHVGTRCCWPKALSKCKNLIICETIAANYDYYPPRRSYERASERIRPAMGCALYPR